MKYLKWKVFQRAMTEKKVFEGLTFKLNKDDKVALIGTNGVGKTTLLKILMEEIEADSGTFKWGQTITHSYFPQNTTDLVVGDEELPQWIQGFDQKWHIDDIRKTLGRMLFSGEEQKRRSMHVQVVKSTVLCSLRS